MKIALALLGFLAVSLAEEQIDSAITQKLEFFSQMEVIQNLEVVQNLENLVNDTAEAGQ